MHSSK